MLRTALFSFLLALPGVAFAGGKTPAVGDPMAHFALRSMNPKLCGERLIATKRLVGAKAKPPKNALILTFGASYCEPCKKELRDLKALAPKLKSAGATLAVVVIDKEQAGIEAMRKLTVDELKLPYCVVSDRLGLVARRWGVESLPTMTVIGPDGKLRWLNVGFKDGALDDMLGALAPLTK